MANRTDRFMLRIDAHLRTLANNAARRAFLTSQIATWEDRYNNFAATDGASEPVTDPSDPPTAYDFLITITALVQRRDLIARADVLMAAE